MRSPDKKEETAAEEKPADVAADKPAVEPTKPTRKFHNGWTHANWKY